MNSCKEPSCVYNKEKKKCVKPNPYIQYISYCKSQNHSFDKCKNLYKNDTENIKNKACVYYKQNQINIKQKTCPKNRRPVDNKCIDDVYNILKTNKYGVKCCYRRKNIPKKKTSTPISSLTPSNPFLNLTEPTKIYLNKDKLKLAKIKHNYQYKYKPLKIK